MDFEFNGRAGFMMYICFLEIYDCTMWSTLWGYEPQSIEVTVCIPGCKKYMEVQPSIEYYRTERIPNPYPAGDLPWTVYDTVRTASAVGPSSASTGGRPVRCPGDCGRSPRPAHRSTTPCPARWSTGACTCQNPLRGRNSPRAWRRSIGPKDDATNEASRMRRDIHASIPVFSWPKTAYGTRL